MRKSFIAGLILGAAYIWHKGLYTYHPWSNLCAIMAVAGTLAIFIYFFIKFLMSASGFVFKILVIAGILFACYHGGKRAVVVVQHEDEIQRTSFAK